jgi:thioredoxin reductase/Pyruvate/2-oxoacid:ferredoxin oxidoreductase delta subunit
MSWTLLSALVIVLGAAYLALRRAELARMRQTVEKREQAEQLGAAKAQLQHPVVDLSRCLGCGTCVAACPEDGVLDLVHGQAMVVRGARCRGHAACERECPVDAITVTLADLGTRRDVPALSHDLEAVGSPGLFLAGEVTAHALIKTAVEQGAAVGAEVARRTEAPGPQGALDLVVVGAGPAGIACSLEAKRNGLDFVTVDQGDGPGGTVAKYPRRKLVTTQPVEMPLYGTLARTSYSKEELVELWTDIVNEQELPIRGGEEFRGLERSGDAFLVHTGKETYAARNVCLAIGRRGSPRKLGVPGEELPKVAYALIDAHSFQDRRILVVGGGDTAVEAAIGLAEQRGNQVALSYRKHAFFRIPPELEAKLQSCVERGSLQLLFESEITAVRADAVDLTLKGQPHTLANDDVFVMIGGVTPYDLLGRAGVSFDPEDREKPSEVGERGTGLGRAVAIGFGLALVALLFAVWHADYYTLSDAVRPEHVKHPLLRPGMGFGLLMGVAAMLLVVVNLLYLVRRSPKFTFARGSLRAWMTSHVATGILALLCATLHAAMAPGNTVGGRAYWALAVLLVTGAVGRYLYAYVPRAANGRELELAEVRKRLGRVSDEWDRGRIQFAERARHVVEELIGRIQWRASLPGRVLALIGVQRGLHRALDELRSRGRAEGVAEDQIEEVLALARRAHGTALMTAHFEDLRALAGSWRYLHRWAAVLMVLLVVLHVAFALMYGSFLAD